MKISLLICSLIMFTEYSSAQEIKSAIITDFGLFNPADPDQLIKQTDTIPMLLGNSFGFHFKVIAAPDNKSIPLTMKISITDTQGNVHDIQYIMNYLPHDFSTGRHSFVFEAQEELIAGAWEFLIEFKGETVLKKRLIVVEM